MTTGTERTLTTEERPLREHYGVNEDLAFARDMNAWLVGIMRDVSNSPHIPPVERRILKGALA